MADSRTSSLPPVELQPGTEEALNELYAVPSVDLSALAQMMPSAGIPAARGAPNENLRAAYQYFLNKGLAPHQAAAIVGNMAQESGGATQARGGNILPNEALSIGLGQWNKERLHGGKGYTGLIPFAQAQGASPYDLQTQLDYAWHELQGPERKALQNLAGARNLQEATVGFGRDYERPSEKYANYENRIAQAKSYLGGAGGEAQQPQFDLVHLDNGQAVQVDPGMPLDKVASILKANNINALPLRNFQTPRGIVQVPYNMADNEVINILQKQKPEVLALPGHGVPSPDLIPALKGGVERGLGIGATGTGEILQRLGVEDWASKAKEFGASMEQKAAETSRPMTKEEMEAQGLWGKIKGKMLQPAVGMLGEVGAPLAIGAATGQPWLAAAGLGAQGAGRVTEAAEAAGKPLSNTELALHTGIDTALNFFRLPAVGPLRNLVAEGMSPAVKEGVIKAIQAGDQQAAMSLLSGPVSQVAKGIGTNYATNVLANVGSEANIRSALGESLTSPEAIEQYKQGEEAARWLSVPFGVHHGLVARKGQMGQVEDIAQEQALLGRAYERQQEEIRKQQEAATAGPEEEGLGEIPEPPLRAKTTEAEQPPVQEQPTTEEQPPVQEQPTAEEPAAPPYYEQLGLSKKSYVYKTLAQLDINNPEHHDAIAQTLDAALENKNLKVKNAGAMEALRDQIRPPVEQPPIPETIEPKRKPEAAKAPEPPPVQEPVQRTAEQIQQEIEVQKQLHTQALAQGDAAGIAAAHNTIRSLQTELKQVQPEVPSAKQEPKAGPSDGGGRPQPIVRQKGRDQTVSGEGVEPSRQGIKAPEEGGKVKKEVAPPPPAAPAPKVTIKRKTAKGSTPEETEAAVKATETARLTEEAAAKPKKVAKPVEAEAPVTPEQTPTRDFDKEIEAMRKQVADAVVAHKDLKAKSNSRLWKIMDSSTKAAQEERAKIEKTLEESRANGIAMKQKLAELEHERAMHEAEVAAKAQPPEKKIPEKLREEPTLTEEERLNKLQEKITQLQERAKKSREEKAKAVTIQSEADKVVEQADAERRAKELEAAKGKPVEGVSSVKETTEEPTPASIKAKIDAVTHPAENLKRRRAKAAKKVEEAAPKPKFDKPEAVEVPHKRPNLEGVFGATASHPEWAKRIADSRNASHVIYSDGNTAIRTTVSRNPFGKVTHGLQVMHRDATGTIHLGELNKSVYDQISGNPKISKALSREKVSDLVKADLAHADEETHQFNLKPEGPVTNAEGNVAHSESVAPELGSIVRDWMKMLGMKDDKIFITTIDDMSKPDARTRYGLFAGPSGQWDHIHGLDFGPNTEGRCSTLGDGKYAITLRDATNVTPKTLEILAHELGHAFEKKEFARAPKEIQDAIRAEYEKWRSKYTTGPSDQMKAKPGIPRTDLISDLRAYHAAQESLATLRPEDTVDKLSQRDLNYFAGFPEWFADQTSKWATTSEKPVSVVDKFFKSIADGLRKLYATLTGKEDKYLPNPVFKKFLDSRETPTLGDIVDILKPSEPVKVTDEEMRGGHDAEDYFAKRKLTQRPPTTAEAAAQNVSKAVDVAGKILTHPTYAGGLFTNLRRNIVDEFAGLSKALSHLPTFDMEGKARADMLASQQRMERQFVGEALQTGFVRRSPSGFFYIESSDKNIHNLMQQAAKLKGLKDPVRTVGDVLRVLVGEHWMKETEDMRHKAAARLAASRRWDQYAKTLTDYEERKKADKMASMLRKDAAKLKARAGEGEGEGLEKLVTQEDIAQAKRLLQDIPGLQGIVDGIHENMRSLVDLHEAVGMISAETAKKWKANPYIPLYKSMQELEDYLDTSRAGRIFGGAKSLPKVHEIMGGTHAVDVFQNLQKHTAMMTMAAFKNNVRRAALDQLSMFGGTRRLGPGEHVNKLAVLVREDGKDVYHEVHDPYIFEALQMAQPATSELTHWLAAPSKVLRAGALMNPGYWYRQLVRDPILVNFVSQTGAVTPLHTVTEFAKIVNGMVTGKAPKEYEVLRRHGLTGVVDPSFTDPVKFAEAVGKGLGAPKKAVNFWLGVHEAADSATRVAVYKQAMKDAKKRGYTGQAAEDFAVMRAREVINFSNRGSSNAINHWRQMVPFFGAALNGLDVVARSATGANLSPKEAKIARQLFWSRAMAVSTMSMALAMYWSNKPEYQNLSEEDKASNWIMGFDKDGSAYKYPIPPDVGFFFKVLPEAMIQNLMGVPSHKDRDKVLKNTFFDTVLPPGLFPPIPQAIRPIIEHVTNWDLHGGFPIESMKDKDIPVEQRGRGKATAFASWLSDHGGADMGWSPAKVDHFFKATIGDAYGTLGMLADMYLKSDDELYNKNDVEKYPWLKAFKTNPKNFGEKGELYEMTGEADAMVSNIRRLFRSGDTEQLRRYTGPADMAKFAASKPLGRIMDIVANIDNQIRVLEHKKTHTEADRIRYDQLMAAKQRYMKAGANLGKAIKSRGEAAQEVLDDDEEEPETED